MQKRAIDIAVVNNVFILSAENCTLTILILLLLLLLICYLSNTSTFEAKLNRLIFPFNPLATSTATEHLYVGNICFDCLCIALSLSLSLSNT